MIEKKRRCAAFAVCGSFCTLEAALDAARALRGQGWELLPVMSFAVRFWTPCRRWSLSAHGIWPTPS